MKGFHPTRLYPIELGQLPRYWESNVQSHSFTPQNIHPTLLIWRNARHAVQTGEAWWAIGLFDVRAL